MKNKLVIAGSWMITMAVVVGGSLLSVELWSGAEEQAPDVVELTLNAEMTLTDIGRANDIPERVLRRAFQLEAAEPLDQRPAQLGLSLSAAEDRLQRTMALAAERGSKNWQKIFIKFGLWFLFLTLALLMMRSKRLNPQRRRWLYALAVLLFGIALGADPSPMGTVKDAIVLFGSHHVIFMPRMIALMLFLLMVVAANKLICSWGCQIGALQDLLFRFNRNRKDRRGIVKQWKPPFWLTNSIRVGFLVALTIGALLWGIDLAEHIDPFKIFKPAKLGWIGGGFVSLVLLTSLFIYRPWCHFLCPFGLVGWIFEKLAVIKIKVDYDSCVACEACAKACPSTVMTAILKGDRKVIPDCFSCGVCLETCPNDAIHFAAGRRAKPPTDWATFKAQQKKS